MGKVTVSIAFIGLSFLLGAAGGPFAAEGQRQVPSGDLIEALRHGGYVMYFRHAATDPDQTDTGDPTLGRCETQRNLSAQGRQMARELGAALQALHIPVGRVVTSPYCRAVDTAELAFGRHEVANGLYFAMGLDKDQRERQSVELRLMISTPPTAGTNTVIVSHNANLKEATGLWPRREGDAHLFKPLPGGRFDHLGEIAVEEWSHLAGRGAPTAPRRTGS